MNRQLKRLLTFIGIVSFLFFTTAAFAHVTSINDAELTQRVKAKISTSQITEKSKIGVSTVNSIVSLVGMVNSDTEASYLIRISQSVEGVKDVNAAQLIVKNSAEPFDDMVTTAKIKGKFLQEKLFDGKDTKFMIDVETQNGIVYLSGDATANQADNAIRMAKHVKNVKEVKSLIHIRSN